MQTHNITMAQPQLQQVALSLHKGHRTAQNQCLSGREWQYSACTDGFVDILLVVKD